MIIMFFQTGIIFIYFVPEEEVKSLNRKRSRISPQLYLKTDMLCDLPDLDCFKFRLDLADLKCLRK